MPVSGIGGVHRRLDGTEDGAGAGIAAQPAGPEPATGEGGIDRAADQGAGAGGLGDRVLAAEAAELPLLPGAAAAFEAMALAERGWTTLKFFPAEASDGAPALGALAGPLSDIGWCPTGGVGRANAHTYRVLAKVLCVGGSWPVPAEAVVAGDCSRIEALAREAAKF